MILARLGLRLARAASFALVVVCLVAAPVALAQSAGLDETAETSADGVGANGARITLLEQTSWVPPDGELVLRFSTEGIPDSATVAVDVHRAIAARISFDETTESNQLFGTLPGGPEPLRLADMPRQADGSIQVTIPVRSNGAPPPGGVSVETSSVHPVAITAEDGDGRELAQLVTHLVVTPPPTATESVPLAVGVVVSIDGTLRLPHEPPAELGGAGTLMSGPLGLSDDESDRALGRIDDIVETTVPLSIDAIPATLEALAQEPEPAGEDAVEDLAGSLRGRQVLANPYVRLDTGAWLDDGLLAELERQITVGAEAFARPQLLGTLPDGRTAVADRTITPAALSYLHDLGVDQIAVPSDQLEGIAGERLTFLQGFEVADDRGDTLQGVVADVELANRLTRTGNPVLDAHRTLAELAVLYNEQPANSRGVALVVPHETDPAALGLLLDALGQPAPAGGTGRAMVQAVTLDDLFAETEVATTEARGRIVPRSLGYLSPPPGSLGRYADQLRATESRLDGFRSLTAPSPAAIAPFDQAVLLSGAIGLDDAERTAILGSITTSIDAAGSEVVAPLQDYVTLTSRSGQIPLNLENRLPYDVRVQVVLESAKLEFPDGSVTDVVIPAGTPQRREVAVTTRASGAFPIDVELRSPDGALELSSARFTVRSTAISGVGLVLSVGAGAFLLVWWARHFRQARRDRRLVSSNHPSVTRASATDGDDRGDSPSGSTGRGYARRRPEEPGGARWP